MNKKFIALLLALSLLFVFTACDWENIPPQEVEETTENQSQPTEAETDTTTEKYDDYEPPAEVPYTPYVPTDYEMRDITARELVKEIKTGWNLGNTFDAPSEMGWGNPKTSFMLVHTVAQAGFDAMRLPVSWSSHLGAAPDYKIDDEWLNRIEEVVGYILSTGMYCILNTHHEKWLFPSEEKEEQNTEQLKAIWTQLCERFADYNEKLIFESMNEPRLVGTKQEWTGGDEESHQVINRLNLAFVETVRASGGNNAIRNLMIPTYAASTVEPAMRALSEGFPKDDGKVIVSLHAYIPNGFALKVDGSPKYVPAVHDEVIGEMFDNITSLFIDEGIPVIMGETGAMIKDGNIEDRVAWANYYFGKSRELGIPTFWWDNNLFEQNTKGDRELFGMLNRSTLRFEFPEILEAIMAE